MKTIAISGNIGVGKTTLLDNLKVKLEDKGYKVKTYKEDIDYEILDIFYNRFKELSTTEQHRVELLNQFHFLTTTITREIKSSVNDKDYDYIIFDRPIHEHINVFAKNTLDKQTYLLYKGVNDMFTSVLGLANYDTNYILIDDIDSIYQRVVERSRDEESTIEKEYLNELNYIYSSVDFKDQCLEYCNTVKHIMIHYDDADTVANRVLEDILKDTN